MKNRKYTDEQFRLAVQKSFSIRAVLKHLRLHATGGNYGTVHKLIKLFTLDTSHFTGKACNKGKVFGPKRPIEDYLSNKFPISSNSLRKRLLAEKLLEKECSECKQTTWNGKPLPLELDHIDGDNTNNAFSNLRILCANCHAQTDTYRRKKSSLYKKKIVKNVTKKKASSLRISIKRISLCQCGQEKFFKAKCCRKCFERSQEKIIWPSDEDLLNRLRASNFLKLSRELGVSDNAIRKRLKTRKLI